MKNIKFLLLIILLTSLVSCKTVKSIVSKNDVPTDSLKTLIKNILNTQPDFKSANVSKMNVSLTYNNRKINVSTSCKLIKDSAIFVSFQPILGVEMAKAEITTDSIWVLDKFNHRCYATDYGYLVRKTGININFYNLQSILLNSLFCVGEKDIPLTKCSFNNLADRKKEILFTTEKLNQRITVSENNRIEKVQIGTNNVKNNFIVDYADFQINDSILFPMKISISAATSKNNINCDFKINKVTFNTNFRLLSSDKTNYTRSDIDQIFNKY
jgi:hypothetical protein